MDEGIINPCRLLMHSLGKMMTFNAWTISSVCQTPSSIFSPPGPTLTDHINNNFMQYSNYLKKD